MQSAEEALDTAHGIGYPVMLKASAGGGGRGMRMVHEASQLPSLLTQAQQEAGAAFSSQDVYMEKLVESPRHIEFQVLADEHGNVEILGERDCSIQRRHQKLLEEGPSPAVSPELREKMRARLCAAMTKIGYTNAGTIEFLMDRDGNLYFIEVNARIQVEHPVTESITGIDLVKSQILIAAGYKLPEIIQQPVTIKGHAIECRINAENPETFAPSPGRITALNLPGDVGIRVDTAAYTDYVIPPFYDSLVAKLIAYGRDRSEAHRPHAPRAGYVRRGGHLHDDPAAPAHHERSGFHCGKVGHVVSQLASSLSLASISMRNSAAPSVLPCASMRNDNVPPPPNASCIRKFSAPRFGSSKRSTLPLTISPKNAFTRSGVTSRTSTG